MLLLASSPGTSLCCNLMGRAPCCDKNNVKKGPWSPEEDAKLKEFIEKHGTGGNWIALPQKAGTIYTWFVKLHIHRCSLFKLGISCCYQLSLNLNSLDSWCWSMSCFSNLFAFFYVLFLWSVWDHTLIGLFWDILFQRKTREKENIYMLSLISWIYHNNAIKTKDLPLSCPPLPSVYNLLGFY